MNNGRTRMSSPARGHRRIAGFQGFTLIELLAVLAVISVLAALVVGLAGRASSASKERRTQVMLQQLELAINDYKMTLGYYPPDNPGPVGQGFSDPWINPLFYELSGATADGTGFTIPAVDERIEATEVRRFFNVDGFANVALQGAKPQSFIQLKADQYAAISGAQLTGAAQDPDVHVLVAPVMWPANLVSAPGELRAPTARALFGKVNGQVLRKIAWVNPWNYVSTNPTNNVGRYDLWAEYVEGKKIKVISNWRSDIDER